MATNDGGDDNDGGDNDGDEDDDNDDDDVAADAVAAANEAFYLAFRQRDGAAMERLWARRAPVTCVHPGWQPLLDRAAVMQSWRSILPGAPAITARLQSVQLLGATAYVLCFEELPGAVLLATNIFVREDGEWRLVHHHASVAGPRPGTGQGAGQGRDPGGGGPGGATGPGDGGLVN